MKNNIDSLIRRIQNIVLEAKKLKNSYIIEEENAPVNYACVFSQSEDEYNKLIEDAKELGDILDQTLTGPLFNITPITTVSGDLKLLKIRISDSTRPEKGDADFTVLNYAFFKEKYVHKNGFKLARKNDEYEMIELMDSRFDVRAYFSNPTLDQQLGIN